MQAFILLLVLFFMGCKTAPLPTAYDSQKLVSQGMSTTEATEILSNAGLTCEAVEHGDFRLKKRDAAGGYLRDEFGDEQMQTIRNVDYIRCHRRISSTWGLVTSFESIYLVLNESGTVTDVYYKTEYIGM